MAAIASTPKPEHHARSARTLICDTNKDKISGNANLRIATFGLPRSIETFFSALIISEPIIRIHINVLNSVLNTFDDSLIRINNRKRTVTGGGIIGIDDDKYPKKGWNGAETPEKFQIIPLLIIFCNMK